MKLQGRDMKNPFDQKGLREREARCTQEQPPACQAKCPMHVDARALAQAVTAGDFTAGWALLEKALPFPRIIAALCHEPCRQACRLGQVSDAVALGELERTCLHYAGAAKPAQHFLPKRTQRVLVAGGGLSGLTAAVELARKGYAVTLWEREQALGGRVRQMQGTRLTPQMLADDLAVLEDLKITVELKQALTPKEWPRVQQEWDAVFLSDAAAESLLIAVQDSLTLQAAEGVFAAVKRPGEARFILEMDDGKRAAISIDRYLQGVSLTAGREQESAFATTLVTELPETAKGQLPAPEMGYTIEAAKEEAARCLNCQCLICVRGCAYLAHYRKYPKKYVREVYNNLSIVMGNHTANGLINACSLCGQCRVLCPYDFDMGEVCRLARETMVETAKMPQSTHEFALQDMAFSNSEAYFLVRHQPGHASSRYVFFPGCQLGASAPENLRAAYEDLGTRLTGGVGLILGCCGAIADWAGQRALFSQQLAQIEDALRILGNPQVITACPTCYEVLRTHLSGQSVVGVWQVLAHLGLPPEFTPQPLTLAVHDACATRYDKETQEAIRQLAVACGCQLEEIAYHHETTPCCGFGGLTAFADKPVAREMAQKRIAQSQRPYLTYCINCRDRFAQEGKESVHLLELIYGRRQKPAPGISDRRYNRLLLRQQLLRDLWKEDVTRVEDACIIQLDDGLEQILEERLILRDDLRQTLEYAQSNGNVLEQQENGWLYTSHRLGNVTFWVVFSEIDGGYQVHNAYSHRMTIEGVVQ